MWIKKAEYRDLIAGHASAISALETLRMHLNRLELENAELRARISGVPARAAVIGRAVTPGTEAEAQFNAIMFEDQGDEIAKTLGYDDRDDMSYQSES